ncbi:hypothetical protein B7C51_25025 (plasmid) [Paenibacillus larvae subsp. pulvifaciens]|uniref:Uncharacterized protein n=2 Tax=Paenibacillus larvae TaxID=1464 RepID=A0A1V0V0B1_9BACL|nr:type I-C CRISPR-associated protein Cas8c/Csd1 [Paenibacillus larvae]ARF70738.1 hypothetical protein B7C51_25025 [Paenibacillus larvae subsp. pulvifaciens]QHZ53380.1 CRISPR-associated protein Cas8c/Csd1, subtype I-C/DVULG [Paenibacillus larvae subsp. larvae]
MEREQKFGRLLAVADILGIRVFESGKPSPAEAHMDRFGRRPADTFNRIHKNIMEYSYKFSQKELDLLSKLDEIMNSFDYEQFNNKPLADRYLQQLGAYRHELRKEGY